MIEFTLTWNKYGNKETYLNTLYSTTSSIPFIYFIIQTSLLGKTKATKATSKQMNKNIIRLLALSRCSSLFLSISHLFADVLSFNDFKFESIEQMW